MANEKKTVREPSFILALVPIVAMIGFMLYCFRGHSETGYHDAHLPLVMSIIVACIVGFICGFVGAGGGMMMLLLLTSVMGYELKTAVGTSVFIMTFTALTGAVSHFAIGGSPDILLLVLCVAFTFIFARIAAKIANKASPAALNRMTGVILVVLGVAILVFSLIK